MESLKMAIESLDSLTILELVAANMTQLEFLIGISVEPHWTRPSLNFSSNS